jgi:hypothetical protein
VHARVEVVHLVDEHDLSSISKSWNRKRESAF